MIRVILVMATLLGLAACGADRTFDPQEKVDAARYVAGAPTYVTLYTVINDRNNSGAHSGLLINASQRVLFDPAGTFYYPHAPIQNDVHFGMTDAAVAFYLDYHARDTPTEKFHVVERTLIVSPETAELILRRVQGNGAVSKALCAESISSILRGVPGFESLPSTWFPIKLGDAFGELPGVTTRIVTEENDNLGQHGIVLVDKKGLRMN
ncbi:MAG: hypothetical protein WAT09_05920 [Paracoccaceae bacterium]